jgi:hypothetical protein
MENNKKLGKVLTFIMLSFFIAVMFIPMNVSTVGATGAQWLTGWSYRKSHVINNATGAGTDYQISITIHYGSGTDSGANVYANSHCKTDFGDIRFTSDDGSTLLNYWMDNSSSLTADAISVLKNNVKQYNGYDYIAPQSTAYPYPYCWDTTFNLIGALYFNTTLAKESINALFSAQNTTPGSYYGMIPNAPSSAADQDLRSETPMLAYGVWEYYLETNDITSLTNWYPKLELYYDWWNTTGSPTGSIKGLTSPCSGIRSGDLSYAAFWACASVLDNHPVYDYSNGQTTHIGEFYYLNISDLQLSTSMALYAELMANMSTILGYSSNTTIYQNDYTSKKNLINQYMWNDTNGVYYPCFWNGTQIPIKSQQMFLTLMAEVPNATQANYLVSELNSESEFNMTYGVPTISASDPKYYTPQPSWMHSADQYYWRGPEWAPLVYLTYIGLKTYGYLSEANQIAKKFVNLVQRSSLYFAEYYSATSGNSLGRLSDFSWTAAVALAFAEEDPSTTFWVKVTSDLSVVNQTIYVYYGKSDATTTSNGDNTFLFFDDFVGSTLNASKWNWNNYGGSYAVSNSLLAIADSGSNNNQSGVSSVSYKPPVNTAIETRVEASGLSNTGQIALVLGDVNNTNTQNTNNEHFFVYDNLTPKWFTQGRSSGSLGSVYNVYAVGYTANKFYISQVCLNSGSQDYRLFDARRSLYGSQTGLTNAPQNFEGNYYIGLEGREGTISFDWILVRKHVSSEPSHGSWGSEEQATVSITITTNPAGLNVRADGGTWYSSPHIYTWNSSDSHSIEAQDPYTVIANQKQYVFSSWSDSGANPHNITVPYSDTTYTATMTQQWYITITSSGISTDSSGTVATLGGNAKTQTQLPYSQWFNNGASCNYAFTSPVSAGTGKQYVWSSTSGLSQTLQSNSFTTSTYGTITGTYGIQYYLTVTGGNSPSEQGWYDSGASATASSTWVWNTVSGQSRTALTNWQLDGSDQNPSRSNTGNLTTSSITMSATHTVNFVSTTQYYLTVTGGSGIGYGTASPTSDNWYDSGTSTTVSSNWIWNTISGQSRTAITNWQLDGSNQNPTRQGSGTLTTPSVSMSTFHTVTLISGTQYYLTLSTSIPGSTVSQSGSQTGDNWYDPATNSALTATTPYINGPDVYIFSNWTWSLGGSAQTNLTGNPQQVTMSNYVSATANWNSSTYNQNTSIVPPQIIGFALLVAFVLIVLTALKRKKSYEHRARAN